MIARRLNPKSAICTNRDTDAHSSSTSAESSADIPRGSDSAGSSSPTRRDTIYHGCTGPKNGIHKCGPEEGTMDRDSEREACERWRQEMESSASREQPATTISGLPIAPLYTPDD